MAIDGSTIIGESILISGSLNGDEDLTVRGRVEGTLTLTRTLVVEPTGVVKAEVQVKNCIIAGAVVGNVTASESVEITSGLKIGEVVVDGPYRTLARELEDGAQVAVAEDEGGKR